MTRSHAMLLSILALLVVLDASGRAEIPQVISYQGKITDTSGNPLADNTYTMRFRLYNASSGGSLLWDSQDMSVALTGGIFSVLLGESPQPSILAEFDADYWLSVTFNGVTQTPRQRLASVGYAYMASGLVPGTEVSGAVAGGTWAAIKGANTATTGSACGVVGITSSSSGTGVHGGVSSLTGTNYGVYGVSASPAGYGVFGVASASTGTNCGVQGLSYSSGGRGVFGDVVATTGMTYGVYGKSSSSGGTGVYGFADAVSGTAYGVHGRSNAASGRGVYGWVNSTTGTNYGVYGEVLSPSGWGGYFSGRLCALASINAGATPENHVALIQNTSTGTSPDVLALKVGYTGNPGLAINYITFFKGNDTAVGAIEGDGSGGITLLSGGGDFAEYLPRMPGEDVEPGDVVGVFEGGVSKRTEGASQVMVVSTRPIVVGNNPDEEDAQSHARVAFIGQVEVKVRGPVNVGDLLVASGLHDGTAVAVPRDGMSDAQARQAFGQAWERSTDSGLKRIRAAVGMLQHDPGVAALRDENRSLREELRAFRQRITALEDFR